MLQGVPTKSLNGLFFPSKSLGSGIKESRVPLELVSSPLVSAGVEGGRGCIRSTELGTDSSDIPDVVAGGVGGPETEVGGVGGKSDASELCGLLCINRNENNIIYHSCIQGGISLSKKYDAIVNLFYFS